MKTIARWVLIVPAAVLGLYIGLFLGILMFEGLVEICPSEYPVTGNIVAGLCRVAKEGSMVLATSLSAVFVVSFAAFVAPRYNATIAWTAYLAGASIMTFLAYPTGFRLPYFGALVCGFVTAVYFQQSKIGRMQPAS